jgi:hypothetical protein
VNSRVALAFASLAIALAGGGWVLGRLLASPDVVLLRGEGGASWIRPDLEVNLRAQRHDPVAVRYHRRFEIESVPEEALLTVHSLRSAAVVLDGRVLVPANPTLGPRAQVQRVELRPFLAPGRHELAITVLNEGGPALLLAHCPGLELRTGEREGWGAASPDGRSLSVAKLDHRRLPAFFADFPTSSRALSSHWRFYAASFLLGAGLALIPEWRRRSGGMLARIPELQARHLRSALLLAWLVLGANSWLHSPLDFGFDARGHAEYIRFIVEHRRLPHPTEGWSMFQSPLYYLIAALPYALATLPLPETPKALPRALLLIPLACGAIQIQLAYAATRRVFPRREDLQALGTLTGGFLPINLYASQHIGNEPLAGALSASALVVALGLLASAAPSARRRDWVLLGVLLGFGLLAKTTAALLLPPLILSLGYALWLEHRNPRKLASRLGLFLAVCFAICGWYYVRNWLDFGSPLLVGTEAARKILWWQEPGYRTPEDFFRFGVALQHPLYASVHGFWDGLYASLWTDAQYSGRIPAPLAVKPWNLDFLLAGSLLGLVPSLALLVGIARSTRRLQTALASLCLVTFVSAMLFLFLRVPQYGIVKATYSLGLLPAYAVLVAEGCEPLIRHPIARSAITGAMTCGAVAAYRAYFAAAA